MIALGALLKRLDHAGLLVHSEGSFDDQLEIDHLAIDSRKVGPRGLFVAIKGVDVDGHTFIDKAVQNGAIAIVCEAMPADRLQRFPGVAFVHVTDGRSASAELAAAFYRDPSRELTLIGVTGTNGKTTVSFLCHHLLSRLGKKSGMVGTVEVRIGSEVLETNLTTPDPLEINRLLRRMVDADCQACVMEVSSHALHQQRARGLVFDIGIFTNLSRDHLDYHNTIDEYLAAKKKLFDDLGSNAAAVYNADDDVGTRMVKDTQAKTVSYGIDSRADVRGEIVANKVDGLDLSIDGAARKYRLVGRFNAYNVLAAYSAAQQLGYEKERVLDCLADADPVPGRFEILRFKDDITVIVDYAHTPDALDNVLRTIQETKEAEPELWCIFGCGGDRDREKRPMMGAVAEKYASRIVITSDNPRTEDPQAIIDDILGGLAEPDGVHVIPDRKEAIEFASRETSPGDVVLIAGKGHETYQIVGETKRPFDDREIARAAFSTGIVKNPSTDTKVDS